MCNLCTSARQNLFWFAAHQWKLKSVFVFHTSHVWLHNIFHNFIPYSIGAYFKNWMSVGKKANSHALDFEINISTMRKLYKRTYTKIYKYLCSFCICACQNLFLLAHQLKLKSGFVLLHYIFGCTISFTITALMSLVPTLKLNACDTECKKWCFRFRNWYFNNEGIIQAYMYKYVLIFVKFVYLRTSKSCLTCHTPVKDQINIWFPNITYLAMQYPAQFQFLTCYSFVQNVWLFWYMTPFPPHFVWLNNNWTEVFLYRLYHRQNCPNNTGVRALNIAPTLRYVHLFNIPPILEIDISPIQRQYLFKYRRFSLEIFWLQ